eukprot:Tamp_26758.p2 GENE.Tamp_26758~~Tamp_26758.p2  ORF type:complete len:196 (-),score=6.44 Tamp_26758:80-667(-)
MLYARCIWAGDGTRTHACMHVRIEHVCTRTARTECTHTPVRPPAHTRTHAHDAELRTQKEMRGAGIDRRRTCEICAFPHACTRPPASEQGHARRAGLRPPRARANQRPGGRRSSSCRRRSTPSCDARTQPTDRRRQHAGHARAHTHAHTQPVSDTHSCIRSALRRLRGHIAGKRDRAGAPGAPARPAWEAWVAHA